MALSFADNFRRHANRLLSVAALVVLAMGVGLVWVRVVHTLVVSDSSRPPIGRPQGVVWGSHVFTNEAQLQAYLTSKGLSYDRWIATHPGAAAILGRKPIARPNPPTATVEKEPTKPSASRSSDHTAARPVRQEPSSISWSTILLDLLIALGFLVGVSALVPAAFVPAPVARFYAVPERRVLASAAAVAILCGLGLSHVLS